MFLSSDMYFSLIIYLFFLYNIQAEVEEEEEKSKIQEAKMKHLKETFKPVQTFHFYIIVLN